MIVSCTQCDSNFAVDDAKVANKKFAFTCPKCENENIIDNRQAKRRGQGGGSIVDESPYDVGDGDVRKERDREGSFARGREGFTNDAGPSRGSEAVKDIERLEKDEGMLDDSPSLESEDLSGLAEPDQIGDSAIQLDEAELPPPDDMMSDIPLDDVGLESDQRDNDPGAGSAERGEEETAASGTTTFEELGEEIGDFKDGELMIEDELDLHDKTARKIQPDESDDMDGLLAEDRKEIVDDFEPLEKEPSDTDAIDIDLDLDQDIKTEEVYRAEGPEDDESITIDLDKLDIELDDGANGTSVTSAGHAAAGAGDVHSSENRTSDDENITIDLDSLDIDLQEGQEVTEGENPEELDLDLSDFSDESIEELKSSTATPGDHDDENITLDLDSLDISLEETEEITRGEEADEDETLTIDDAGMTIEELTSDELSTVAVDSGQPEQTSGIPDEQETADAGMSDEDIERELREAESILAETPGSKDDLLLDELEDLPDIDFDQELGAPAGIARFSAEDDLIRIDDRAPVLTKQGGLQKDLPDMVTKGAVNFSIDYSIRYSRIGALLRLTGLFGIGMIFHYLVFGVYNILSLILGFLNNLIVVVTGRNVEDFSDIHQNTLRYLLSISASLAGVVEEMPIPAGREDIDYPLQMRIIYPARSSRLLALLRLTGVGIVFAALPHILILGLMSLCTWAVYIAGVFSILITGRWPHILFDFMTRYYRYTARVLAFAIGAVDSYPPFSFD